MEFVQHPDGYVRITAAAGVYSDTVVNFALDLRAVPEALPAGIIARIYRPGALHALSTGSDQKGGPLPWAAGDGYIAAVATLLDRQAARRELEGEEPEPEEPTLDELQRRRKAQVDARLVHAFDSGLAYGGKVLQIREADQQNVIAMSQRAALAQSGTVTWPAGFAWRMADNTFLPVPTPAEMIALATAAADEVYRLRQIAWGHKDAIDALATAAEVAAYDIEQGW